MGSSAKEQEFRSIQKKMFSDHEIVASASVLCYSQSCSTIQYPLDCYNMKLKDRCSDQWFFGGKKEILEITHIASEAQFAKKNPLLRKLIDKLIITKEMQGNLQHVSSRRAS